MWKALKRISSSNKWGDSFSGKSTLLVSLTGSGWFYSKITEIDRDSRKNAMQRHCDLLNVTKVFNGRVQTWPGGHKRHLCPRSMESTVCLNGILASLVISQGQLCTPGLEGLPWILSRCVTQGHRVGLNWAGECFLFGQHSVSFNMLPRKMYNAERIAS